MPPLPRLQAHSLAIRAPERIRVQALYAAPFTNERSTGPADGMVCHIHRDALLSELFGHLQGK